MKMPTKPTRSLGLLPTTLFAAETAPLTPVVLLPHVTAPRSPFQLGLLVTKLPLLRKGRLSFVVPEISLPTASFGLVPTRLLASEMAPLTPVVPLPHVSAPRIPFQDGLWTT